MEVKTVPINDIKPYDKNPRKNEDAVEPTANSIKEFGWQQPIVVDNKGVIIAGHTRYLAAKKLGMKEVPVVVASNLTPEQVKAYRLADNKTGELADWNDDLLIDGLKEIDDIDMSDFGFESINEPELPDDFFEDTSDDVDVSKDNSTLDWGTNSVSISSEDQSILDNKLQLFNKQEGIKSFVQFLLSE